MFALRFVVVLALLASMPSLARSQDCLSGTVVAEETSPGSGVWRYRATLAYDVGTLQSAPNHFRLFLEGLASCGCSCEPGKFGFDSPAGSSPGVDQVTGLPGRALYVGTIDCGDDATQVEFAGRSVKWETRPTSTIEPSGSGTGRFSFLSPLPPASNSSATAMIKFGRRLCSGTVTGALPACDCATSVHAGTWGRLKVLYR